MTAPKTDVSLITAALVLNTLATHTLLQRQFNILNLEKLNIFKFFRRKLKLTNFLI